MYDDVKCCNKVVQWDCAEVIIFFVVSCVSTLNSCWAGVNMKTVLNVKKTSIWILTICDLSILCSIRRTKCHNYVALGNNVHAKWHPDTHCQLWTLSNHMEKIYFFLFQRYKPLEVKVNRGVAWLQDGPKTPEEVGCLREKTEKTLKHHT